RSTYRYVLPLPGDQGWRFRVVLSCMGVMLDFDRRRPILGGISRGRKKKREKYKKEKKRENMEIWHCSPDLDLSPASFLALREENLRRSRGENDARASSTHVGFLGRRRFFSPHGEKKCFPAWGEGTRRPELEMSIRYEMADLGSDGS
ncbi:hypothetical protein BHM03_00046029, partial [Ensete ventricosum]